MRTLGLLAALLALAFPGWAKPLEGATEQVADTLATRALVAEDQAPVMDGQDQPEDKEQDVVLYFYGDERLTRDVSALRGTICTCRTFSYKSTEFQNGICPHAAMARRLCCIRL